MRLARILRSTVARMFVPVAMVQMLAIGSLIGFIWVNGQDEMMRQEVALVDELHADLRSDYDEGGISELEQVIAHRIRIEGLRAPVMILLDKHGRKIQGNIDRWPDAIMTDGALHRLSLTRSGSRIAEHMALRVQRLNSGHRLIAGWSVENDRQLSHTYERALLIALLLSVPLALLVALLIARMISRRIHHLAETAHRVGSGALHVRVPMDGSGDSFDQLGKRINEMLDRIESLVIELRLVTDGLAHDLRSPVTRLKSVIERALSETTEPRAIAALESAANEADFLIAMLGTALQITRAEAGIGRESFTPTDLGDYLSDLVELYAPMAEDRGFALVAQAEKGLVVPLHREIVGQSIGNLIDNAMKYASGGNRITVAANRRGGMAAITVCDNGPGIPAERRSEALKRFGRLDPARGITGSGLGLSLAESVARLHAGSLILEDGNPGLCVRMMLPTR